MLVYFVMHKLYGLTKMFCLELNKTTEDLRASSFHLVENWLAF